MRRADCVLGIRDRPRQSEGRAEILFVLLCKYPFSSMGRSGLYVIGRRLIVFRVGSLHTRYNNAWVGENIPGTYRYRRPKCNVNNIISFAKDTPVYSTNLDIRDNWTRIMHRVKTTSYLVRPLLDGPRRTPSRVSLFLFLPSLARLIRNLLDLPLH